MARRYRMTFDFVDTEEEAKAFCDTQNKNYYLRKKHPAHYTPWVSQDGREHKFVVWYYV